ncbi:trypsin-like [Cochliomyia hominivorax]
MFRYFPKLIYAFAGDISNDLDDRIVNGVDTTIQAHPYQVSIQTNYGAHFCGDSIISEDIVVTAAHCMQEYKASQFKVRLGSTEYNKGGKLVTVRAFRNHELFNPDTMVYDVAVIKLATPVRESSTIRYIKLAEKTPPTGTSAVVTGWGYKCAFFCKTFPKILQKVEVDIVDEEVCVSSEFEYGDEIMETMLKFYKKWKLILWMRKFVFPVNSNMVMKSWKLCCVLMV